MSYEPGQIYNVKMFASDQSLSANRTSNTFDLRGVGGYSVEFYWSGASSPVGTVSLYASNDLSAPFVQISDSVTSISGNSGSIMYNVEFPKYVYVQLQYASTSGTGGAANAIINAVK